MFLNSSIIIGIPYLLCGILIGFVIAYIATAAAIMTYIRYHIAEMHREAQETEDYKEDWWKRGERPDYEIDQDYKDDWWKRGERPDYEGDSD